MDRRLVVFLIFALLAFGSAIVLTSLQERAHSTQMDRINRVMDEAEQEMGIYDEESSREMPALERAKRLSAEGKKRADESRRMLDSLTRADREEMGETYSYEQEEEPLEEYEYTGR